MRIDDCNDNPLVSVVIPAYNASKWLEETLRSVIGQNYRPIEIVVVDDGSTDGTRDIADRVLTAPLPGIRYTIIWNISNQGAAFSLNKGFKQAQGDYICWLSADDLFVDRGKLDEQVAMMEETGAEMCYYQNYVSGETQLKNINLVRCAPLLHGDDRILQIVYNNPIFGSSVMLRRTCLTKYGNFDPVLKNIDADGDMWLRMVTGGASIIALPNTTTFYRIHPEQASTDQDAMLIGCEVVRWRLIHALISAEKLSELVKNCQLFKSPDHLIWAAERRPFSSRLIASYMIDMHQCDSDELKNAMETLGKTAQEIITELGTETERKFETLKLEDINSEEFRSFVLRCLI